jgi:hypothetical protein
MKQEVLGCVPAFRGRYAETAEYVRTVSAFFTPLEKPTGSGQQLSNYTCITHIKTGKAIEKYARALSIASGLHNGS